MWQIIHSYTASMPDRLSRVDKIKFRQTLADLVDHLPCDDCKHHARAYLKENKPLYKNNQEAFQYYCDFHNHINQSTGKPVQDCQTLWEKRAQPCTDCSTTAIKVPNDHTASETNQEAPKPENPVQSVSLQYTGALPQVQTTEGKAANESANDQHSPKHSLKINQFLDQSLKTSLQDFKNVSTRMFETMCSNAGVPMPELIFSEKTACSNPDMSCTHFPVNKSGALQPGEQTKVYLNVNQYSPRSVIHEALHYIAKVKGIDAIALNEEDIMQRTSNIMSRDWPRVRSVDRTTQGPAKPQSTGSNPVVPVQEVRDTVLTPAEADPYKHFKERSRRRLDSFSQGLPYFSKYYHGAKRHKGEQPAPQVVSTLTYSDGRPVYPQVATQAEPEKPPEPASMTEGFTSMLDPIYAPFADMLGLKARDVNEAHTPNLLANGGIVLVESNMNKFGSMALSLVASLTTLAAGTLAKDSIGFTDKKLLVGLGGALFWNGALRYLLNPKIQQEVIEHAQHFGNSLATGDVNSMVASVTRDEPPEVEKNPATPPRRGGMRDEFRKNLSSPVGGQERLVSRDKQSQEYSLDDVSGDLYEYPDSTIASQGSWKKPSWFPSMS